MQQNNYEKRQQILKMLSLDTMINEYLKETTHHNPFHHKRQYKKKHNVGNKDHLTSHQSDINFKTLPVTSDKGKRTNSLLNMRKTKIDKPNDEKSKLREENRKILLNKSQLKQAIHINFDENKKNLMPENTERKQEKQTNKMQKNHSTITATHVIKSKNKTLTNLRTEKVKEMRSKGEKKLRDRYVIENMIGRGLSGVVFKAKDILADRYVAIKVISTDNIEYDLIKTLEHRNLISYYNSFIEEGKRYLILEYLPYSLTQLIKKQKLTEFQIKTIFKSIANGLLYLHSLSFAHRDIKLDNILTNQTFSEVKFIDFGLCIDTSKNTNRSYEFCGTTSYMAPEIIERKCSDAKKADIWSLGIVLYTLLVGRCPFKGKQQFQIYSKIRNNRALFPSDTESSVKDLISSMLRKDPNERPNIMEVMNHEWMNY